MADVPLTPAEINDVVRACWTSVRVVLLGTLAQSPHKRALIHAVRDYRFPADSDSLDHSYANFKHDGRHYSFKIEPDQSLPKVDKDGLPLDGRVVTVGLCESHNF